MSLLRNLAALVLASVLAPACAAESAGEASDENAAALGGAARRFDVVTMIQGASTKPDDPCPAIVPEDAKGHRKCMHERELAGLNAGASHFVAMPTSSHRAAIRSAGNFLSGYIDQLNDGFPGSGAAAADAALGAMARSYEGNVPEWIILNEISASRWPDNADYRAYVRAYAARLHELGHQVIVCAPFERPLANGPDWKALGADAFVAAEVQLTGSEVARDGDLPARTYAATIAAYARLGVPQARLMIVDNFANSPPGVAWGRSGASLDDWKKAIGIRTRAARAAHFAGYVSYAWDGNDGESDSDTRIDIERHYLSQSVLP